MKRKANLRIRKETFGTKDITEVFTEAFAPYFVQDQAPVYRPDERKVAGQ